jgi:hypothetical protein
MCLSVCVTSTPCLLPTAAAHWLPALAASLRVHQRLAQYTFTLIAPFYREANPLLLLSRPGIGTFRPQTAAYNMASTANNRYDADASPKTSPSVDPSDNPFLNQVADDSIPWQQVKKRGAPAALMPPLPMKGKTLGIRDLNKVAVARNGPATTRARTASASTVEAADKVYNPHENWCGVCSLKLPNKAALLNHIKLTPDHKHYCNLCKRVFKDRNGLKNHLENSFGHEVYCNLCLSAFNDEWGLKNHFENNYTVGHEFVCLACLLSFRSQIELVRHLQTAQKHTWCEVCKPTN